MGIAYVKYFEIPLSKYFTYNFDNVTHSFVIIFIRFLVQIIEEQEKHEKLTYKNYIFKCEQRNCFISSVSHCKVYENDCYLLVLISTQLAGSLALHQLVTVIRKVNFSFVILGGFVI